MSIWLLGIPLISALIGYFTNWVAIRMLFRPHHEKRVFGVRIPFTPGLIPKRRAELARSVGRSVSRYLLTEDAIRKRFETPAFREQIDDMVVQVSARWLEEDLPSVNELVPDKFKPDFDRGVDQIKERLDGWIESLLANPEVCQLIEEQTDAQLHTWLETSIDQLVPEDLLQEMPEQLGGLLQRVIESENLKTRIDRFLTQRLDQLLEEDKPLNELVPPRFKEVFYENLEDIVPVILDRMVIVLQDPIVRKRIKIHLFEMVDNLLNKQFKEESVWDQFKLGLMESFVISPEEIKQRIEDAVDEAGPRIGEIMRKDDVRQRVYQGLVDAIDRFLDKRVSEFNIAPETMDELKGRLSTWIISIVQSDALRRQLVQLVRDQLDRHRSKTLRELLPDFSDKTLTRTSQRISTKLIEWLQGESVRRKVAGFISRQVDIQLDRSLGRLDRFIPEKTMKSGRALAGEKLVELLVRETPRVMERLNVEQLVADQVDTFSVVEVERLVVDITGQQLQAITWFGALLGFFMGLLQLGILFILR